MTETHDENTIRTVLNVLQSRGFDSIMANDAIIAMQNAGILFREYGSEPEETDLERHARRELELLGEGPEDIEKYLRVIHAWTQMEHSGYSASVAIPVLFDLLHMRHLTQLTDDPDEWEHHSEKTWGAEGGVWQSKRNPQAFSHNQGRSYYLVGELQNKTQKTGMYGNLYHTKRHPNGIRAQRDRKDNE
jgi:hypothetical protein